MRFGQSRTTGTGRGDGARRVLPFVVFGGVLVVIALGVKFSDGLFPEKGAAPAPETETEGVPIAIHQKPPARSDTRPSLEIAPAPAIRPPDPLPPGADALPVEDWVEQVSEPGLVRLFQQIRTDPTWVNEPLPGEQPDTTALWRAFIDDPDAHRGEPIFLEGTLVAPDRHASPLELQGLPRDNPSGLDRYHDAFVSNGQVLFLAAVWKHSGVPFADGDSVRVRGRFLQIFQYEIQRKGRKPEKVGVPVIVGEAFTRFQPYNSASGGIERPIAIALIIVGVCFVIALAVIAWIFKRGERRYDERVRQLRRRLSGRDTRPSTTAPSGATGTAEAKSAAVSPGDGSPEQGES